MFVEEYEVRGKKRYRFGETYKSELTGKYKKVSVSYLKNNSHTQKEAAIQLAKKIEAAKRKEQSTDSNITLRELADKFLTIYQHQVAPNTYYATYRGLVRICNDLGGDTIARKITTEILNRYLDQKLYNPKRPLTNASIQNYKKYLSMTYKYGVKYGYIKNNPVASVDVTWRSDAKRKRDRIENKYLEDDEYERLLKAIDYKKRQDIKEFCEWLYLTGMRCGEAAGLYVKDIIKDDDGAYKAVVNGSLVYQRNANTENSSVDTKMVKTEGAKTIAGNREVLLPSKAVNIYKHLRIGKNANDLLFINQHYRSHQGFSATHLDRFLHRLEPIAGIDKKLTTHIFRHTHVSKLAELGVPLFVIKNHVGHENSKITEQIYLHVTKKMEKSLQNKLEQL